MYIDRNVTVMGSLDDLEYQETKPVKKVSVVITNYSYDEYLNLCVKSVKAQTYKNIEIIVVNDSTGSRIFSVNDGVSYYPVAFNSLAKSANYGFSKATGSYYFRLDADDFLSKHCIEILVNCVETNNVGAVYSDYWDWEDDIRGKYQSQVSVTPHGSCMLIDERFFNALGGYSEARNRQEDYEFFHRLSEIAEHSYIALPLWYYRQHSKQMSNSHNIKIRARQEINEQHNPNAPKILTVIPARIGSKGVPRKNLYKIDGISLVARSIKMVKESKVDTLIVVSTDSDEITDVAQNEGVDTIKRPSHLATDDVSTIPVTTHAVESMRNHKDWNPDIVITVQPTSPFTEPESLAKGVKLMLDNKNADSCVSMSAWQGTHPYRAYDEYGNAMFPVLAEMYLQRQDRPKVFRFTGGFYIRRVQLLDDWSGQNFALGECKLHILVTPKEGIDIDNYFDLWLAEAVSNHTEY